MMPFNDVSLVDMRVKIENVVTFKRTPNCTVVSNPFSATDSN